MACVSARAVAVVPHAPLLAALVLLVAHAVPAAGKGFLVERKGSGRLRADGAGLKEELSGAMGEALGCGGHVGPAQLAALESELEPMWRALPKNADGRAERRSLRYLVHRFFNRRSAIHVRGFEPSRPANASGWGEADILAQRVPAYVESVLEARQAQGGGFSLRDAATIVATLGQLIFDAEGALLEKVYHEQHKPVARSLSQQGLGQVLESYLIHWMLGDDSESIGAIIVNRSLVELAIPHWDRLVEFAQGQIQALQYQREHHPQAALKTDLARQGHNALAPRFSFEDAHTVVGGITRSFASFWDSECSSMKGALVKMDKHRTGRVPLGKFYGSALDSEWRFGESEGYLRELGALDETSWMGKQVVIPNYIQAASNCIVSTPHYLLCCVNECEALLGEIEATVGAPVAPPALLLSLVGNMSSQTTLDDDFPPALEGSLSAQLQQIADSNGGAVPLHGRLFAQWLHYAFPRECPFPHKAGSSQAALTPTRFGDNYVATDEEMRQHAAAANASEAPEGATKEELQWMSQWSSDEELLADHAHLRAPWERPGSGFVLGGAMLFALAALLRAFGGLARKPSMSAAAGLLPMHGKSHFV